MKIIRVFCGLLLFFPFFIHAQSNYSSTGLREGVDIPSQLNWNYAQGQSDQVATADTWSPTGPHGITAYCITANPSNKNVLYAGGLSGLFKSTNGGVNWLVMDPQFNNQSIVSIGVNPSNPSIVFVWSQSCLMRTTNSGVKWDTLIYGYGGAESIIFDPSNSQNMITKSDSIYFSSNGGTTWHGINQGYVSTFAVYKNDINIIYEVYNGQLYRSGNRGQSWSLRPGTLPAGLSKLKVSAFNANMLFAGSLSWTSPGGIYMSSDTGSTWLNITPSFLPSNSVTQIGIDPLDQNTIFIGGQANGLFISTNLGVTWKPTSTSVPEKYIYGLTVLQDGTIYCAFGGSIYSSGDMGNTWQSLNGDLNNIDVFRLVIDPSNDKIMYASTLGGMYRSTDGGSAWEQRNTGIQDNDLFALTMDQKNTNILYAGSYGGMVYKTTDAGLSWAEKSLGLPGLGKYYIWDLKMHPTNTSWIWTNYYGGTNYQSTDGGEFWSPLTINSQPVRELITGSKTGDILYSTVGSPMVLMKSTDSGNSWTYRDTVNIIYLAVDPNNSNVIYADSISYSVKSTDGGLTWKKITPVPGRNYFVNPGNSSFVYISSGTYGVGRSTDAGSTFYSYNNGLPYLNTFSVCSSESHPNRLFVTTYGGGIYAADQFVSDVADLKTNIRSFSLAQNYPNPFNPSTQIVYQIPKTSLVSLKVYNILGKEVVTLVNDLKSSGQYRVNFNAGSLPSGIYFYTLKAGSFSETKKLILLK
jgi:photosystem II stability/assembly factor-like uncharacterized protein